MLEITRSSSLFEAPELENRPPRGLTEPRKSFENDDPVSVSALLVETTPRALGDAPRGPQEAFAKLPSGSEERQSSSEGLPRRSWEAPKRLQKGPEAPKEPQRWSMMSPSGSQEAP